MSTRDPGLEGADPDTTPQIGDEAATRAIMGRNRRIATGLLIGMGGLFAASHVVPHPGFAGGLLRAGSEAGIVGGLADWFAVTALFRHPLGLPIPHTAILPRSKERIGRALAAFVERGFLTEATLLPRIKGLQLGRRLAGWLSDRETVATLVEPTLGALPQVLQAAERGPFRDFLNQVVGERLRAVDFAPIAGRTLEILTQSGEGDILFEKIVAFLLGWLQANRIEIDRLVAQRSRWWVPASLDRKIANTILEGVSDLLAGLHDPDSPARHKLRDALAELIEGLKSDGSQRLEWNAARDRLLGHPELQAWLNAVWSALGAAVSADLVDPSSRTRAVLENAFVSIGEVLAADPAMQARIDGALERLVRRVLVHRGGIATYMTDVIRGWDARTVSDRFELVIGSDLQFIRMNGTIVGALVGCGLFVVTWLLGR